VEKTVWKAERAWFLDQKEEESEAWNRAVFDSLGQKRRVFGIHWPELSQTYSAADFIGFPRGSGAESGI